MGAVMDYRPGGFPGVMRRAILLGLVIAGVAGSPADTGQSEAPSQPQAPFETEFVYEAHVTISAAVAIGETAGGRRRYIPITGGRFDGPRLKGVVMTGGADWQTERKDGVTELDARYAMRCDDGTVIVVRNRGIVADGGKYLRTVPSFVAPEGPHAWLNQSVFLGTVSGSEEPDTVIIRVFRVR